MFKIIKTLLHSAIIIIMIGFFARYLIYNPKGIKATKALQQEAIEEAKLIQELNQKVTTLKGQIDALQNDPFEKERIAREELLMGHPNEYVYVFKTVPNKTNSST